MGDSCRAPVPFCCCPPTGTIGTQTPFPSPEGSHKPGPPSWTPPLMGEAVRLETGDCACAMRATSPLIGTEKPPPRGESSVHAAGPATGRALSGITTGPSAAKGGRGPGYALSGPKDSGNCTEGTLSEPRGVDKRVGTLDRESPSARDRSGGSS